MFEIFKRKKEFNENLENLIDSSSDVDSLNPISVNPLDEAEIYMQYKRFEQAKSIINEFLLKFENNEPNENDIHYGNYKRGIDLLDECEGKKPKLNIENKEVRIDIQLKDESNYRYMLNFMIKDFGNAIPIYKNVTFKNKINTKEGQKELINYCNDNEFIHWALLSYILIED